MRQLITTIVLLVVAGGLGTWIYFFERGPAPEGKLLLRVDPEQIEKLELHNLKDKKTVVVQRFGKASWRIVSPINAPADKDTIQSIIDRVKQVKIDLTLEDATLHKKEFGFKNPEAAIVVHTKDGRRYKIVLAKKTPDTLYAYAYREDKRKPVVIDSMLLDDALKSLDDLRDKKVTRFNKDKVTKLVLKHPDETIVCVRSGEERWKLTAPIKMDADKTTVEDLLDKLSNLEAQKYINDNPKKKDLRKYALLHPSFTVEVWLKGRSKPVRLQVGTKSSEDTTRYYARSTAGRSVFLIDETSLKDIKKRTNDLRSKKLLVFDTGKIERIKLHYDNKRIEIHRKRAKDEEETQWFMTKPVRMRADKWRVDDLLWAIHDLEADEFIDAPKALSEYGLDKPQVKVELYEEKRKKPLILTVGKMATEDSVYAKAGDAKVVCRVRKGILDDLKKDVNDLRNLNIVRFKRDDAEEITIEWRTKGKKPRTKKVRIVRRGKDAWRVVEPKRKDAKKNTMENILWELEQVRADKWVTAKAPDEKYGFDKPQLKAIVKVKGKGTITLTIGKSDEKGENVYLRSSEVEGVYLKSDYILDNLKRNAAELIK